MKKLILGITLLTSAFSFAGGSDIYDFNVKINNNAPDLVSKQEIIETLNEGFDKKGCKANYASGILSLFQSARLEIKVFKSGSLAVRRNYAHDQYQILTVYHASGASTVVGKLEDLFASDVSNLLNGIKCD